MSRNPIAAELRRSMEAYFAHTRFCFGPHQVLRLRRWMELVYLREHPLVAIDVEAWERDLRHITEIGVAVYDPVDQYLLAQPYIRTLHILVEENRHRTNGRYVPDNLGRFNNGVSYRMSSAELRGLLREILAQYLTARRGVLVGHSLRGDVAWLALHGVDVAGVETVDTEQVHRLLRREGGLVRGLLRTMQIPHLNLHNAGNDAYYTLLAALAYLDPAQRTRFGLDEEAPPREESAAVPGQKSAKARKRAERFTDSARVLSAAEAPTLEEFMRSNTVDRNGA